MNLTPLTADLIQVEIGRFLTPYVKQGLWGISCLAAGADTIFANQVIRLGGRLQVILPSPNYRERKVKPADLVTFDALIGAATKVTTMPFTDPNRDAYQAANETLMDSSDLIVAVWDGRAAADKGGTGAVVEAARARAIPVQIIWPEGAERA